MTRPTAEPERTEETEDDDDVQDSYEDRFFMDYDEPEERYRPRKTLDDAKEILDDWLDGSNEEKIKNANSAWTYPDLWTARKMNLVFVQALIDEFGRKGWPLVEYNLPEKRRTKTELKDRYALTACMTALRTLEALPEQEARSMTSTPRKGGRTSTLGQHAVKRYIDRNMSAAQGRVKAGRVKKSLEFIKKEYYAKALMLRRLLNEVYELDDIWSAEFSIDHLRILEYLIAYYKIELLRRRDEKINRQELDDFFI